MFWNGRLVVINDIENLQEMSWDNYKGMYHYRYIPCVILIS